MPITTHTLPMSAALQALPFLPSFRAWYEENLEADQGAALDVPRDDWPSDLGVDAQLLLLLLPEALEPRLAELAESELDVFNWHSPDGWERKTFMALEAEGLSVEVDAWKTNFPRDLGNFYVALAAGDSFVLARHDLESEEPEALLCGLQCAVLSTGPNYSPNAAEAAAAIEERSLGAHDDRTQKHRVECVAVFMRPADGEQ